VTPFVAFVLINQGCHKLVSAPGRVASRSANQGATNHAFSTLLLPDVSKQWSQ